MATAVIGRLLVASLHQAITEHAADSAGVLRVVAQPEGLPAQRFAGRHPRRLQLPAAGRRRLRAVVRRAGEIAAAWQFDDLLAHAAAPGCAALPRPLRLRAALGLAQAAGRRAHGTQSKVSVPLAARRRHARGAPVAVLRRARAGARGALRLLRGRPRGVPAKAGPGRRRPRRACRRRAAETCTLSVAAGLRQPGGRAAGRARRDARAAAWRRALPRRAPAPAARGLVLVMPFDNASAQAKLAWLGEGVVDPARRTGSRRRASTR